ncbi:hypothetical protein, partial [uncultured Lamprocystis sp.]|uniref:hypothetical protein n=1 Tax=uncultured Lamprocystis sp. TaxID=543132 RepID=UPI0025F45A81
MARPRRPDPAQAARDAGIALLREKAVLLPLLGDIHFIPDKPHLFVADKGWLAVTPKGSVYLHPTRRAAPEEWARVIGIAAVCLGFGMVRGRPPQDLWETACLLSAERFCDELKLGQAPEVLWHGPVVVPAGGEDTLFSRWCADGVEPSLAQWQRSWCGDRPLFVGLDATGGDRWRRPPDWPALLAEGIAQGVGRALRVVGGR